MFSYCYCCYVLLAAATLRLIFALPDISFKQENMLEQRNQLKCLEFARVFDELLKVPSFTLIVVNLAAISSPLPPTPDVTRLQRRCQQGVAETR